MNGPPEPGFAFGQARYGQHCCGKPVGCTATHAGCFFRFHAWKRGNVLGDPRASCMASSVIDRDDGIRDWLRCTRRHHDTGGHVMAVVKTTTPDREEMTR